MYFLRYTILLLAAHWSTSTKYSDIEEAFTSFLITPFVIPEVPPRLLSARFYANKIHLGNKIPAYGTVNPPVVYYEAKPEVLHTIVILDADPPSAIAPVDTQMIHALLINVPGNKLAQSNYATAYYPTVPPVGSGYHRIVLLVYQQPCWINMDSVQKLNGNYDNFSITRFAAEHGLGSPIAGNFYLTQLNICDNHDESMGQCSL
ncbi:protein D2-like [Bicyclus anynana]|uniref:Protein D2-like n=1 Tax=Bicyclus anynana TaxID=110368 RepID=A0ABM3LXT9_BICAN|nr:protein D2-like [Bicyclus anynana]